MAPTIIAPQFTHLRTYSSDKNKNSSEIELRNHANGGKNGEHKKNKDYLHKKKHLF